MWKSGFWYSGTWEDGTIEDIYKNVGFSKWKIFYSQKTIKIGCYEKTTEDWEDWFAGEEIYETKRGTKEFDLIYKSFMKAKFCQEIDFS
ncbi:hypothetical protein D1003_10890 [Riemerella anatipestifer]|nr:hypothetical protein [Riemerella anatipestifer]